MKRVKFVFRLLPLATIILLASCNKDIMSGEMEEITDGLMMQKSAEEAEKDPDALTLKCQGCQPEEMRAQLDACAVITDSGDGVFPRTITIDYGTEGCGTDDKHLKKGKIIVRISADMATVGAVRTVTFENFFVGEREMSGTRSLTNISTEVNNQPVFAYEDNIVVTHDGKKRTKTASGTRTWIAGYETSNVCTDDKFEMTGSATMSCRDNKTVTRVILEPIVFDASCGHPISGVEQMTDPKGTKHTLDFGDGTCDNEATVTHDNGETETVDLDEMRMHKRPGRR